ncbi:1,5-anhydro-D-fructose reductase [Adhaeretor mobilis]|uniref:1,5-anhydro-D-fructose reductase n=2 Tax=Adhaeretor mobilis TaxID=1930276 RepID=A0A517MZU5_9BACT|nr:1,5-anhydro-D-fructose reductase [Adhaeretor mobilis]
MEKLRWAIVGLGDIVRKRVGPAILEQPQSVLQACVTRDPDRRTDELRALVPGKVYTDFEQMLTDTEVDAVYIATPVFLHAPQAIAALRAGKHVLVEKPMALDASEAEAMNVAAKQAGRRLSVAYYRRFWPTFQRVHSMLEQGDFGQIVLARVALHSWYAPSPNDSNAWRVRPEYSGGGVLSDVGSHRLDLLAWWFGLPQKTVSDVRTRTQDYSVEDSATGILVFADGFPCTLSFQWNSKTWTDELHIVGSETKVSLTPTDSDEMKITCGRETTTSRLNRHPNAHYGLIDDFATSILEGRAPRFSGDDGIAATQMMDWIKQAATCRTWIEGG